MRVWFLSVVAAAAVSLVGCAGRLELSELAGYERISYVDQPQQRQYADVYLPRQAGPHPAVMVIHGGGWARGEPEDMQRFVKRFLQAGYAVMNLSYRLAPEHRFPAQSDDVAMARRWLSANAQRLNIDDERVAVMGYSAGGHLALMLGLQQRADTAPVQAVISGAGPTDMSVYYQSPYLIKLIGGPGQENAEAYRLASPVAHVSTDDPPVMLYHGRWDRLVGIEQSRKMAKALKDANVEHELLELPLSGHMTAFVFDGPAEKATMEFLRKHLGSN